MGHFGPWGCTNRTLTNTVRIVRKADDQTDCYPDRSVDLPEGSGVPTLTDREPSQSTETTFDNGIGSSRSFRHIRGGQYTLYTIVCVYNTFSDYGVPSYRCSRYGCVCHSHTARYPPSASRDLRIQRNHVRTAVSASSWISTERRVTTSSPTDSSYSRTSSTAERPARRKTPVTARDFASDSGWVLPRRSRDGSPETYAVGSIFFPQNDDARTELVSLVDETSSATTSRYSSGVTFRRTTTISARRPSIPNPTSGRSSSLRTTRASPRRSSTDDSTSLVVPSKMRSTMLTSMARIASTSSRSIRRPSSTRDCSRASRYPATIRI